MHICKYALLRIHVILTLTENCYAFLILYCQVWSHILKIYFEHNFALATLAVAYLEDEKGPKSRNESELFFQRKVYSQS